MSRLAQHDAVSYPGRRDFPVLENGFRADVSGSISVAKKVLKQIDIDFFCKMKMVCFAGISVPAAKKINIKMLRPPGAFFSIITSFNLNILWTAAGTLIVDDATGQSLQAMI